MDYEAARKLMLKRGHTEFRASMYAQAIRENYNPQFAEVFACCWEEQMAAGRTQNEAERFAKIYTDLFDENGSFDESYELHDFAIDRCTALTEAAYRYCSEYGEKYQFIETFGRIHQQLVFSQQVKSRHCFDDVEARTKLEMADPGTQLGSHGCLQRVRGKEADVNGQEKFSPIDIKKISTEELKRVKPKTEEEQELLDEEDEYRSWCFDMDVDPLDPESRAMYKEQGADTWDDMDENDRDGWTDNMNK